MEVGKEIELRSEEVQEVMGQIPAWIVRWGVTSVAGCVVAGGYSVGLYESGIERYLCPRLPGFDWTVTGGDPCLGDILLPGGAVGWKGKGRAAGDRAVYEFPGSGVRYRERVFVVSFAGAFGRQFFLTVCCENTHKNTIFVHIKTTNSVHKI